jgi:hypothetical protein
MTITVDENGNFDRARVAAEIARLEGLARDLRGLLADGAPRPGDHEDAPVIHDWSYGLMQVLCLTGRVAGYPDLNVGRPGKVTVTSDLWVLDRTKGFARTLSRWYRLGAETPEYVLAGRDIH